MKFDVPKTFLEFHDYKGGIRWRLTDRGVEVEGRGVQHMEKKASTPRRVWDNFHEPINKWAGKYQVPVELLVALICVESHGQPKKVGKEPGYESDEETPSRISFGLTQFLLSTARELAPQVGVDKSWVDRDWLFVPENNIMLGAYYTHVLRKTSEYDPGKVGFAHNHGTVEAPKPGSRYSNPWNMISYVRKVKDKKTNEEIRLSYNEDFIPWFNDFWTVLDESNVRPALSYWEYFHDKKTVAVASQPPPPPLQPSSTYKYPVDVANVVKCAQKGGQEFVRRLALKDGMRDDEKLSSVVWNTSQGLFPIARDGKWHFAVDIGFPKSPFDDFQKTPVYATADGEVIAADQSAWSEENFALGRLILRHQTPDGKDFFIQYRHVQGICAHEHVPVKAGDKVCEVGWHGSFPHVEVMAASLVPIGGKELEPECIPTDIPPGLGAWSILRVRTPILDPMDWPVPGVAGKPGFVYNPIQLIRYCLKEPYRQVIHLGTEHKVSAVKQGTLVPLSPAQSTVKLEGVLRSKALRENQAAQKLAQDPSFQPIGKGCSDKAVVEAVQATLVRCHYRLGRFGANHDGVDGDFGDATEKAVTDFQKEHLDAFVKSAGASGVLGKTAANVRTDGKVDWLTLLALDACALVIEKTPAPVPKPAKESQPPPNPEVTSAAPAATSPAAPQSTAQSAPQAAPQAAPQSASQTSPTPAQSAPAPQQAAQPGPQQAPQSAPQQQAPQSAPQSQQPAQAAPQQAPQAAPQSAPAPASPPAAAQAQPAANPPSTPAASSNTGAAPQLSCTFDADKPGMENLSIHFGMRMFKVLKGWLWDATDWIESKYQADHNYQGELKNKNGVGYSCVLPLPYGENKPYPSALSLPSPPFPEQFRAKDGNNNPVSVTVGSTKFAAYRVWGLKKNYVACNYSACSPSMLAALTWALCPPGKTDGKFQVKGGFEFRRPRGQGVVSTYDILNTSGPMQHNIRIKNDKKTSAEYALYAILINYGGSDAPYYTNPTTSVPTMTRNGKTYSHLVNGVTEMGLGEPIFPYVEAKGHEAEYKRMRLGDLANSYGHAFLIGDVRYGVWLADAPSTGQAFIPHYLIDQSSFVGDDAAGAFFKPPAPNPNEASYLRAVNMVKGLGPRDPQSHQYRTTEDLVPPLNDHDCDWLINSRTNEKEFLRRVQAFLATEPAAGQPGGTVTISGQARPVQKIEVLSWRVFSANVGDSASHIKHGLFYDFTLNANGTGSNWKINVSKTRQSIKGNGVTCKWKHRRQGSGPNNADYGHSMCRFYPPA